MLHNFLKLNCSKTELMLIGTVRTVATWKIDHVSLVVESNMVLSTSQELNLGVIFGP